MNKIVNLNHSLYSKMLRDLVIFLFGREFLEWLFMYIGTECRHCLLREREREREKERFTEFLRKRERFTDLLDGEGVI